jgi:hypothetical protein
MKTLSRCAPVLALSFVACFAGPVFGQTGKSKSNPERLVEVKKVFGYYDIYLNLPPQDRDGLLMRYMINARGGAGARPQLFYVLGATRTPIEIAPNGLVISMPDLNMFRNGKVLIPAGQPRASIGLDLEPRIPLSRTISASDATNPISDYATAVRRAGPLGMVAPRLSSIRFVGVTSGEAILRDGRRVALPAAPQGGVLFNPSTPAMRGVTNLSFATTPSAAEFAR